MLLASGRRHALGYRFFRVNSRRCSVDVGKENSLPGLSLVQVLSAKSHGKCAVKLAEIRHPSYPMAVAFVAPVFVAPVAAAPFGMAHAKAARLTMAGPLFE